jgi:hypothetical protein
MNSTSPAAAADWPAKNDGRQNRNSRAMDRLEQFREWYTELFRPWHSSCLPEELSLPGERFSRFEAEQMLRNARLGSSTNCEFGVFQILGLDEARRAARIWSPVTRLITWDVSLAFGLVEKQRQSGEIVSNLNVTRLVETLYAYFKSVGRPQTRETLRAKVERFIEENSLSDAEGISPIRLPVSVNVPLLDELRLIDKELQDRFVDMHGRPAGMHWIGLGLDEQLDDHRYGHSTPLNCRTFAGTGGDGDHYSFLVIDGAITETAPVVATVPGGGGKPSAVIAEALHDFLRMGCIKGYDELASVALSSDEQIMEFFTTGRDTSLDHDPAFDFLRDMLAYLRTRLNLVPWTDWQSIREAQRKYDGLLRHPPDVTF